MFKRTLTKISLICLSIMVIGCGQISELLDSGDPKEGGTTDGFSWHIHSQAPQEFGGHWERTISVKSQGSAFADLRIEKRTVNNPTFRFVGLSNEEGLFYDANTSKKAQYRFGGKITSDWIEAESDLVLSNEKEELFGIKKLSGSSEKEQIIRATRIYIPADEVIILGPTKMQRIIAQELIVEGELRAFAKDCTSGKSAGHLEIRAKHIRGNGLLDWSGCNGKSGARGKTGNAGRDGDFYKNDGGNGGAGGRGSNGTNAGNGGTLTIRSDDMLLKTDQIIVSGGRGGLAGPGGHGGRAGRGKTVTRRRGGRIADYDYEDRGRNGSAGPSGPTGKPGKNGKKGILRLLSL